MSKSFPEQGRKRKHLSEAMLPSLSKPVELKRRLSLMEQGSKSGPDHENSYLYTLPDHVLLHIFRHLNAVDLSSVSAPAGKQNGPRFVAEQWTLRGPRVGFATTSTVAKVPARAPPVVDHAARPLRRPWRTWTLQRGPRMDHHEVTYVDVAMTPDVVLSWTLSRSKIEQ
jgi:hypothetical protein